MKKQLGKPYNWQTYANDTKRIKIIGIMLLIFASCQNKKNLSGYEINGILKNVPDSTVIYLSVNNKNVDTTLVFEEKFQFFGHVEKPTHVYLHVKNSRDYKPFWLENYIISIVGEKGLFFESKVTGSETQKDEDILSYRIRPLRKKQDSLVLILRDRSIEKSYYDSISEIYKGLGEKEHEIYKNFIKEFPNSLVSSHVLNIYKTTWGKEITNDLFLAMSEERKESEEGQSIARFVELNKNPQIGDKYVDFEQPNIQGEMIKLSDIKGEVILVEFWASWCGPCRKANSSLVKLYDKYKNKGFEILGVSIDQDRDNWIEAIEKDSLIWENVSDLMGRENEAHLIYGGSGIPDNILINRDGIIIGRKLRADSLNSKLEELLASKAGLIP